jgi:putative ubiquitin-RnfH superfamily antitoxin RatB of RatAB toxin-antitoxin module
MDELCVEVIHADATRQIARTYRLTAPATVATALERAAAAGDFPGVDLAHAPVGVWGVAVGADHRLRGGERIEIYRPLAVDPKLARRERARRR